MYAVDGILYTIHYFFFFKQKTAYEMRISDWSSDVCASDLKCVKGLHLFDSSGAGSTSMTIIKEADLIESVADALQFISYYHPMDYIRALGKAYEAEKSPAAKDAIAQILTNSRMCAEGHRPICQDTQSNTRREGKK